MYFGTGHMDFSVQLQIHQNKEFAQILYTGDQDEKVKSVALKPGYEYTIELSPNGQKSTEGFRNLPIEDRKCQLDEELDENSIFKIYTKANCMYECEVTKAYEVCQCIPWDFFHILKTQGVAPECDVFGRTCFQNAINLVPKETDCQHCIDECDMLKFHLKMLSEKNLASEGNPYFKFNQ